jgi:hypothetical protein
VQQKVRDLLAGAGIVVRERPGADPLADVDDPGPLSLLRFQARNLALEANKGNGTLGADLDAFTESGGGSSISYLIAGWAEERVTPSAAAAADLLGFADAGPAPVDPPDLLIPSLVVVAAITSDRFVTPSRYRRYSDGRLGSTRPP